MVAAAAAQVAPQVLRADQVAVGPVRIAAQQEPQEPPTLAAAAAAAATVALMAALVALVS